MSEPFKCPFCEDIFRWGRDADSKLVTLAGCGENAFWKLTFHVHAKHADKTVHCPRRGVAQAGEPSRDFWDSAGTCSYCGSLAPDALFAAIDAGAEVIPTDKNYKAYVTGAGHSNEKFYYQHLDEEQKKKFIKLYNLDRMKVGVPGHFYVMPFFMRARKGTE